MNDQDQYYRQRMDAELAAAERATDASVAAIHRALADRYRKLLGESVDEAELKLQA